MIWRSTIAFFLTALVTWAFLELPAMGTTGEFPKPALSPRVLAHEGGFSNHPRDPGGPTLQGIIQREYDNDRHSRGLPTRPLSASLLRDSVWPTERDNIYSLRYWKPCRGADLPRGVGYAVFDFCVNSGPGRGGRFLRRAVGVDETSWTVTDEVVAKAKKNPRQVCVALNDARDRWLRTLSTYEVFGKGWAARVRSVKAFCLDDLGPPPGPTHLFGTTKKGIGERLGEIKRKIIAHFGPGKAWDWDDQLEEEYLR